jgi:hypothetical protein
VLRMFDERNVLWCFESKFERVKCFWYFLRMRCKCKMFLVFEKSRNFGN